MAGLRRTRRRFRGAVVAAALWGALRREVGAALRRGAGARRRRLAAIILRVAAFCAALRRAFAIFDVLFVFGVDARCVVLRFGAGFTSNNRLVITTS